MKILLTSDLHPSSINGVATSVLNLKFELEKMGHEVKLLTLGKTDKIEENNIYTLSSVSLEKIYSTARATVKIKSHIIDELIQWHPDIVHTNCEFSTFIVALKIAHKCNIPIIHTYHTVYEDYTHYFCPSKKLGKSLVKKFSKSVAKHVDAIIVPTKKVYKLLDGYGIKQKMYIIPTGINLEQMNNKPSSEWIKNKKKELGIKNEKIALFLGRLAKEKNINTLIKIANDLPSDIKLLIVGDGPEKENILKLIDNLGLKEKIILTGMVKPKEVQNYYRLGDIFVNATTSETQGLTYFEAMSCGLPLVCIDDMCLENIVKNGYNGYRCKNNKELKEKIISTLNGDINEMSQNAIEVSKRYSIENFGKNVENTYIEVLKKFKEKTTYLSK